MTVAARPPRTGPDARLAQLQLRKLLTLRHEWFERCLDRMAEHQGYGHLSRPLVQLMAHIGRRPVTMGDVAEQMGTSRQWISRLANEGRALGLLELTPDPGDRRAMMIGFSPHGWTVVRQAVASMAEIEAALAERIGRDRLNALVEILSLDWGPAEVEQPGAERPRRRPRPVAPPSARRFS